MILYSILGLIWIAFIDFVVQVRINEKPMSNLARLVNFVLWPINLVVFIAGAIKGYLHGSDDEE